MRSYKYQCCSANGEISKSLEKLSSDLKIIADSSRIKIICILNRESYCVSDLACQAGLSQSLTSHHLKDLKSIKLLVANKKEKKVIYSLSKKGKEIVDLIFKIKT
jgi:DNA-binding transcriptional ArsR family regulator